MVARRDPGSVTAEFAVVLPAVVLVAVVLVALARTVTVSMDCQDAAAVVARELVLVVDEQGAGVDALSTARRVAGPGTSVSVEYGHGLVNVRTQCPVLPDPFAMLPTSVHGSAVGVAQ